MGTATEIHTNGKTKSFKELMEERQLRAEKGLESGAYTVDITRKDKGSWAWAVHGPNGAYTVTAHKEDGRWRWECECKDFRRHADTPGWQCKHIHMVKLAHKKNGNPHRTNGVNGRAKAVQAQPAPAPQRRLSNADFRDALYYAVEVIERGEVRRDGPHTWVIRDRGEEVRVHGDGRTWTCAVCNGECRHTVTAQVHDIMQQQGFWAPLPATRVLEARRKSEGKSGSNVCPSDRTPVTVMGSDGTDLIRVLDDIAEQLWELNMRLQAVAKAVRDGLEDIAVSVETTARGGG